MSTTEKIIRKLNNPFREFSEQSLFLKASEQALARKPENIIKYGYDFLDEKLIGIDKAELIILGAETGIGKSTFMRSVARAGAEQGYKVLYFILEDNPVRTEENEIYLAVNRWRKEQGKSAYPYEAFLTGTINKEKLYQEMLMVSKSVSNNLAKNLHWITGKASVKGSEVLQKIEDEKDNYDLFFIDHLHYLEVDDGETKQLAVEKFMKKLSKLVSLNSLRVIMASHYKKLGGNKPTDEAFKDAQAIAQNATMTIHIYRNKSSEEIDVEPVETNEGTIIDKESVTEFYIEKVRNLFASGNIKAYFNRETGLYEGYTEWNKGGKANNNEGKLL